MEQNRKEQKDQITTFSPLDCQVLTISDYSVLLHPGSVRCPHVLSRSRTFLSFLAGSFPLSRCRSSSHVSPDGRCSRQLYSVHRKCLSPDNFGFDNKYHQLPLSPLYPILKELIFQSYLFQILTFLMQKSCKSKS